MLKAEKNKTKAEKETKKKISRKEEEEEEEIDFDKIQQNTFLQTKTKKTAKPIQKSSGIYFDEMSGKIVIKAPKTKTLTGYKRGIDNYDDIDFKFQANKSTKTDEQMGAMVLKRIKMARSGKGDMVHQMTKKTKMTHRESPHAFVQFNPIVG